MHATHVLPPEPQEVTELPVWHVPFGPVQHPPQVLESHEQVPFVLSQRPFAHDEQTAPALPHAVGDSFA